MAVFGGGASTSVLMTLEWLINTLVLAPLVLVRSPPSTKRYSVFHYWRELAWAWASPTQIIQLCFDVHTYSRSVYPYCTNNGKVSFIMDNCLTKKSLKSLELETSHNSQCLFDGYNKDWDHSWPYPFDGYSERHDHKRTCNWREDKSSHGKPPGNSFTLEVTYNVLYIQESSNAPAQRSFPSYHLDRTSAEWHFCVFPRVKGHVHI